MAFDPSSSPRSPSAGDDDTQDAAGLAQHLRALAHETYGYLTTRGRASGRTHEVEIWFAVDGGRIYMLSGGREKSDWVKNALHHPGVTMRIASTTFAGNARVLAPGDEDMHARELLAAKYQQWSPGLPLSDWARTSLPIAIDVRQELGTDSETTSD